MNSKLHYNSQKLTISKPLKKSQFTNDEGESITPLSNFSMKNRQDFQTDDSDTGTPLTPSPKTPAKPSISKFKPQQTTIQQLFTVTARQVLESKHTHSDAELKKDKPKVDITRDHPFRHLIFGHHIDEITLKKHLILTQRGLIYATKCLKGPSEDFIKSREVDLPTEENKKKILLLDLDETLVHSCSNKEMP